MTCAGLVGLRSASLAGALLAIVALAGCSEDGSDASDLSDSSGASESSRPSGRISGVVLNDEALPVAGAEVAIDVLGLSTLTDADGLFALDRVPTGQYVVEVQAIGYVPALRTVSLTEAEGLADVEVRLEAEPDPVTPHKDVYIENGFISCSLTIPSAYETYYTQPCGWDSHNAPAYVFPVNVNAGLVSVVLELEWTPTTGLNGQVLRQALWKNVVCTELRCEPTSFDSDVFGETQGESPLKAVYGSQAAPLRKGLNLKEPDTLVSMALVKNPDAATSDPTPGIVIQQPFTHYVTVFYNSEPAPDYTARDP